MSLLEVLSEKEKTLQSLKIMRDTLAKTNRGYEEKVEKIDQPVQ